MNPEYEKKLEAEINLELKGLPALPAPSTLISRVLTVIDQRLNLPWYHKSWQMWPLGLRAASFLALLALFGAICFASWKLSQAESFAAALQRLGGLFSGASAVWNALSVLLEAIVMAVKRLGAGFIIACLLVMALGYAMCVGLGTVYMRLALARR